MNAINAAQGRHEVVQDSSLVAMLKRAGAVHNSHSNRLTLVSMHRLSKALIAVMGKTNQAWV